mmetsp:Transcript_297/g.800  ORF Transcript_297/g.800 Transcript_297/m.800 type:complete len:132 (+) Transcript_297:622-1017(+)
MYMARTTNVVAMATPHTTARTITTVVESVDDDDDDVVVVPPPLELPDNAPEQAHFCGHASRKSSHDRSAHAAGSFSPDKQLRVGAGVGEAHPHLAGHGPAKKSHDKLSQKIGSGTPLHSAGLGGGGATVVG